MITLRQIDAALSLLGLNRSDLSEALNINKSTFNSYFTGKASIPSGRLGEIQKWLEGAGIIFTEQGGVNPNNADIILYKDQIGFQTFMRDVLETTKLKEPDICVSNANERNWQDNIGSFHQVYIDERSKLKRKPSRILVKPGDVYYTATAFAEYRQAPNDAFTENVSFYAYGEKLALINFESKPITVLVLNNPEFAKGFRTTFNFIWNNSAQTL